MLMVLDGDGCAVELVTALPPQPIALPLKAIAKTIRESETSLRNSFRRLDERQRTSGRSAKPIDAPDERGPVT